MNLKPVSPEISGPMISCLLSLPDRDRPTHEPPVHTLSGDNERARRSEYRARKRERNVWPARPLSPEVAAREESRRERVRSELARVREEIRRRKAYVTEHGDDK